MTWRARALVAGLSVLAVGASSGSETGFAQSSPDVDATFTVTFADGRSTYKVGELIPLVLEFTGRAGPEYSSSTGSNRRPALVTERYAVTPGAGITDPLAEYLATFVMLGSGLRGLRSLDGSALQVRVYLNEWVRFDRPGEYELVVTSNRLERSTRAVTVELRSNPLRIWIEPADPGWAAAELARATAAIAEGTPDRIREGIAVLQHLGTRGAALALLDCYDVVPEDAAFAITAGLVGSPHRAAVIEAMEARVDGGVVLPPRFLADLSHLRVLLDAEPGATTASVMNRVQQRVAEYHRRWLEGVRTVGVSSAALAAAMSRLQQTQDPEYPSLLSKLLTDRPGLAQQAFLSLPSRVQDSLLQHRWEALNGPWIQPALETLYEGWQGVPRVAGAGDVALKRLSAIDPARAESLALEELRTGRRRIHVDTLTSIVSGPAGDLDDALVQRYRSGVRFQTVADLDAAGSAAWLMARYGSAALLPFVRSALQADLACDIEAGLIGYLLRHDPVGARLRLSAFNRPSGCIAPPLDLVASRYWSEELEDVAIAQLRAMKDSLVVSAASVLGRHGSARARQPLLDRFVQWEAEWRGRAQELDALDSGRINTPERIENTIVNALFSNRRIALTEGDIVQIRALCVTDRCRRNVDALTPSRPPPIN